MQGFDEAVRGMKIGESVELEVLWEAPNPLELVFSCVLWHTPAVLKSKVV